ncbi:MAG: TRAP transporter TatT component family protein [Blastocatellia bacterium]
MKSSIFSIVVVCFLFSSVFGQLKASAATVPASANPFQEADWLFTFGEDAERDKQSLAVIERELASNGNDYQWQWRAARVYYYVGDAAGKTEKLSWFEKGMGIAHRAIAEQPNAVEGHFWLAANYGGYSEQKGAFKALTMVKKIRAEMETVLRLNDHYQDGGAYLALGEMDRQLPRLIGGNLKRAIQRLEQGVNIAPGNLEMKLALAQAYQEAGRKEDARRYYQEIVQKQVRTRAERDVQEKAKRLAGKL